MIAQPKKTGGSLKTATARRYDSYLYKEGLWESTRAAAGTAKPRQSKKKKKTTIMRRRRRQDEKLPAIMLDLEKRLSLSKEWNARKWKRVTVHIAGRPETAVEVEQEYAPRDAQDSWPKFLVGVEEALKIGGIEAVLDAGGGQVWTFASLEDGGRYAIEPSDADKLLGAILDDDDDDDDKLPPSSDELLRGSLAAARAHLHEAIREAEKDGWVPSALDAQTAREKIEKSLIKGEPPKARTRAEVLAKASLEADRELAAETARKSTEFLEARERAREELVAGCLDPDRDAAAYFRALDEIEVSNKQRCSDAMSREDARVLFRRAVRWMANAALEPESARAVLALGACDRALRYLDETGPLRDDFFGLQYAVCFFANIAGLVEDKGLARVPLASGGAALALSVLHAHCAALREETADADRQAGSLPSSYTYAVANPSTPSDDDHPSSAVLYRAKRVAAAPRTNERDAPPTELERVDLHWWALSTALALLGGPAREIALPMLVGDARLIEALRETLVRWSRYRIIAVVSTWLLQELVKEPDLRPRLEALGFLALLQVAQTRHRELEDLDRDIESVLEAFGATQEDRRVPEAVGTIEHVLLDHPESTYRALALGIT